MNKPNLWEAIQTKILETAKWLKTTTKVIVNAEAPPRETTVDGRFGKRLVYIIDTVDYGWVYVTPLQLCHICDELRNADWRNVTVEL